ncbi:MAG TPA: SDR family NAD(P)-dependent oxidoreductase, partial [Acidimicrobiia bacterium]|nr:SDR family NAD(P)-dependent oxidoreductase [Acidimicrobiia bacterium]
MRVLITGGTGFIGSHTAVELIAAGHEVVLVDNLANSSADVVHRLGELTGSTVSFHQADIGDPAAMDLILEKAQPEAVVH